MANWSPQPEVSPFRRRGLKIPPDSFHAWVRLGTWEFGMGVLLYAVFSFGTQLIASAPHSIVTVFDFTNSANPREIAFWERGPISTTTLAQGGSWSAYWYNGHIYGAEIARGIDVFRLTPSAQLSRNEIDAASIVYLNEFNAQQHRKLSWPASPVVVRAYLDQLARSKWISAGRARAVRDLADRADRTRTAADRGAAGVRAQLEALAEQLEADARAAKPGDAARLTAIAAILKTHGARLRCCRGAGRPRCPPALPGSWPPSLPRGPAPRTHRARGRGCARPRG